MSHSIRKSQIVPAPARMPLLIFFIVSVFSTACIRDVEVELPDHTPVLVVNCTFTPDSMWLAHISSSVPVLDPDGPQFVEDATVLILLDGTVVDTLQHGGNGFYLNDNRPLAGGNYGIRVSAPGFATAEAYNTPPPVVPLLSTSFDDSVFIQGGTYSEGVVRFSFQDAPAQRNYYVARLAYFTFTIYLGDTLWYFSPVFSYTTDPRVNEPLNTSAGLLFSDALFDGETMELPLNVDDIYLADSTAFYVVFGPVSEEYYQYVRGVTLYQNNDFNPFSEPVLIPTNVQNGLGLFGAYSTDTIRVK